MSLISNVAAVARVAAEKAQLSHAKYIPLGVQASLQAGKSHP